MREYRLKTSGPTSASPGTAAADDVRSASDGPPGPPAPTDAADANGPTDPAEAAGPADDADGPDAPRKDGLGTTMRVLLIVDLVILAFVFGLNVIAGIVLAFFPDTEMGQRISQAAADGDTRGTWIEVSLTFLFVGIIPILYGFFSRVRPWLGGIRYFRLQRPWPEIPLGILLGLGMLFAIGVLNAGWICATQGCDAVFETNTTEDSVVLEDLLSSLTWPLAIFIALAAGFGEEALFRGVLQKHVGWIWQGVLFGITHAGYGTAMQIIGPLVIGLVFGYLVKRGSGLWLVIAAHFTFNFVQLASVLIIGDT